MKCLGILLITILFVYKSEAKGFKDFTCQNESANSEAITQAEKEFSKIFKQATTKRCFPTDISNFSIPMCPKGSFGLQGLDSTYPVGAIFITYTGKNQIYLRELIQSHARYNPFGIVNLLVPTKIINQFVKDKIFLTFIDKPWINLIPLNTSASYIKWPRDIFRLVNQNSKPALLHLNYGDESEMSLNDNVSCEISRQCKVPYLIPDFITTVADTLQGLGIDLNNFLDNGDVHCSSNEARICR